MSCERSESARCRDTSTAAPPSVLLFFDYACVFCYTEWFRFAHLADRYGAELTPVLYRQLAEAAERCLEWTATL